MRAGPYVCAASTAPIAEDGGTTAPGDVYAQSVRCLDIAERALAETGASLADVTRTHLMLTDITRWREAARAQSQRLAQVRPTCTYVEGHASSTPNGLWSSRWRRSSQSPVPDERRRARDAAAG